MHPSTQHPSPPPPPPLPYPIATVPVAPTAASPAPIVDPRAKPAAIALIVSAAFMLVGLVAKSWFTARGGGSLGLLGMEMCSGRGCHSINWFDVPRAPAEIKIFAMFGLIGGAAAIAFIAHAAVMLLRGTASKVKVAPLNISLGLAVFGALSFFMRLAAGEMSKGLAISWAGFLAIGGMIAAGAIATSWVKPLVNRR